MEIIFLLQSIISFLISTIVVVCFFRNLSNKGTNNLTNKLVILFFGYMVIFLISVLSFLGYLDYDLQGFFVVYSIILFAQTINLFFVLRCFSNNLNFFYLLSIYIVIFLSFFTNLNYFISVLTMTSFFITFILGLLFFRSISCGKIRISYLFILYSLIGLLISFMSFFKTIDFYLAILPLNLIFLLFLMDFSKNIYNCNIKEIRAKNKYNNYFNIFIKYFVFIIVIITLTLISSLVSHEFGHVLFAKFFECPYKTIFFEEGNYPYTQILCADASMKIYALLAGPLLPILLSIVVFFFGGKLLKEISLLVIGFDLVASFRDFYELGISPTLLIGFQAIGFIFLIMGVIVLSKSKFDEITGLKNIN